MRTRFICERCGIEAPTREILFRFNVAMILVRQEETTIGHFCKRCVHRSFWAHTGLNLALGWWGPISFFITPVFLVSNAIRYVGYLGMPRVPRGARRPEVMPDEVKRLAAYEEEIVRRMEAGHEPDALAMEFASETGLTPGQVIVYLEWLHSSGRYDAVRYAKFAQDPDPMQKPWW